MAASFILCAAGLTLPCDFVRVASFNESLRESFRAALRAGSGRQKDAASSPISTGQGGGVFFGHQELVSINGSGGQVEQQGMHPVGFAQREP